MSVPYATATTGTRAQEEVKKILLRLGCESVGFMDIYDRHELLLAFTHRGRQVELRASAQGWAAMWLKKNPWTYRCRRSRVEYERDALKQGYLAINSSLRDWVKGQVTAIESGMLSFETVFMPFMLTNDGRPLAERITETGLLAPPAPDKVVQLPQQSKP